MGLGLYFSNDCQSVFNFELDGLYMYMLNGSFCMQIIKLLFFPVFSYCFDCLCEYCQKYLSRPYNTFYHNVVFLAFTQPDYFHLF